MSDGPHRSLNMRPGWKRLAEVADNRNFAPEDVCERLPKALESDWRLEVPERLCRQVRTILNEDQNSLFGDPRPDRLESLRRETAGYPLAGIFLDCAIEAAGKGLAGDAAVRDAASNTLLDRATRSTRQVEEHYRRESSDGCARHVRERFESAILKSDFSAMAGRLTGLDRESRAPAPQKRTAIDDGVPL